MCVHNYGRTHASSAATAGTGTDSQASYHGISILKLPSAFYNMIYTPRTNKRVLCFGRYRLNIRKSAASFAINRLAILCS